MRERTAKIWCIISGIILAVIIVATLTSCHGPVMGKVTAKHYVPESCGNESSLCTGIGFDGKITTMPCTEYQCSGPFYSVTVRGERDAQPYTGNCSLRQAAWDDVAVGGYIECR